MQYPQFLRSFLRRPVVNLTVALSLALGISGTSAVLKLADSLFERGAPGVGSPRSLARLYFHDPKSGEPGTISYPNYSDYARANAAFESLAAVVTLPLTVSLNDTASRLPVGLVSPNFFSVLRADVLRGRSFASRNNAEDARSAIISYDLWSRSGTPHDLANLKIEVNGSWFGVIGVASPGFHGPSRRNSADVWIPAAAGARIATGFIPENLLEDRESRWFDVIGRLRPGVSFREAQAEVRGRTGWLEQLDPKANGGRDLTLGDWHEVSIGSDRLPLVRHTAILGVAAVLVLLIACANVANLLVSRNLVRKPEIALRFALGASRIQVGRMILGESLVLALAGGALGMVFETATGSLWASLGLPVSDSDFRFDARSAALTLVVSVIAGLVVGAIPSVLASRRDLLPRTKSAQQPRGRSWGGLLVTCEVALALTSLALSSLIVESLYKELTTGFGFDPEGLAVAQIDFEARRYPVERANSFYHDFLSRVRSDRRISAAGMVRFLPFDDTAASWIVYLPGQPADQRPEQISLNRVGGDFFRTMNIPIVEGQDFQKNDDTVRGVIVSESLARRFWPNRSPLGERISLIAPSGPFLEVVGVAKDAKWKDLQEAPAPYLYLSNATATNLDPLSQLATGMQFVVRTHGDPHRVLADLRRTAADIDPSLSMPRLITLADYISSSAEGDRVRALLLSTLAVICMMLCAIGVYAVLSQVLAIRAQELAIRLALGAPPPELWRTVVLRGIGQILTGVIFGLLLTWMLGRLVQSQLYDVDARDFLVLGSAALAVLGMGLSVCMVQGGKAVRVASGALMAEIRQ
jgi:putative ABC transport system permease protein